MARAYPKSHQRVLLRGTVPATASMSDLGALDSFSPEERETFFNALDCLPFDGLAEIGEEWSKLTGALGCRSPTEVHSFASSEMDKLVSDPEMVRRHPAQTPPKGIV